MSELKIPNAVSTSDLLNLIEKRQQEEKIQNRLKKLASKNGNFTENLIEFINETQELNSQNHSNRNLGIYIFKDREPLFISTKVIFEYLKEYKNLGNEINENLDKIINITDFEYLTLSDMNTINDYFVLDSKFEDFCLSKLNQ